MEGKGEKRILCVGDSLTKGYYFRGYKNRPYSVKLQELINKNVGESKYKVLSFGENGEITHDMKGRFERLFKQLKDTVSHVIILGGTNDCGHKKTSDHVFQNIKEMVSLSLKEKNMLIFSIQVPTNYFDTKFADYRGLKKQINGKLREFCEKTERVHAIDLGDYEKMTEEERKKYFEPDNLHYSADGYDMIAGKIFDQIVKYL